MHKKGIEIRRYNWTWQLLTFGRQKRAKLMVTCLDKLATYAMMAEERMPIDELNKTIAQNIELVLQLGWNPLTGKRQLTHIYEVAGTENGKILGQDLWAPDGEERSSYTGGIPRCVQKMKRKGVQYTLPPQRSLGR